MKHIKLYLLSLLVFCFGMANAQFITTWKTDNSGSSGDNQITIPTTGGGYNYIVDWGDGSPNDTGVTGNITHTYAVSGTYTVTITGTFPQIYFNAAGFFGDDTDHDKILTVEQWGNIAWSSMSSAFSGCSNLQINAVDAPDLSAVFDLTNMFREASSLNADLSSWNTEVSNVELFNGMFREATSFNGDITGWDVSSAEEMSEMFFFASAFNQDIGGWQTTGVNTMALMFAGATVFNQDISTRPAVAPIFWITSSVTNMDQMFAGTEDFNQPIGNWDVSSVTLMRSMFSSAHAFNQNISGWNISGLSDLSNFFKDATAFNQDISSWNTNLGGVTNMTSMFESATSFNQALSGWNVINVTNMNSMFANTTYNQDITGWIVSNVVDFNSMFEDNTAFNQDISTWSINSVSTNIDMRSMFSGASSFNQNLGGWVVTGLDKAFDMLDNSGLSVENYDNLLIGWEGQLLKSSVNFGAEGLYYCAGATARQNMITNRSWFITDAGLGCIKVFEGIDISGTEIINGQPEVIDFGSIDKAPSSKTLSFTIENRTGSDLSGFSASVTGSAFTITVSPPPTINAGFPETIDIELSNVSAGGPFTETVTFTSTVPASSFNFVITGEVTDTPEPEIKVFQGLNPFGTEIIDGDLSPYYMGDNLRGNNAINQITILNNGSADLDITSLSILGTQFSLNPSTPFIIAVGNNQVVDITLDGGIALFSSETLTISSNDSDESVFNFVVEGEIYGPIIKVVDGTSIYSDPTIDNGQINPINFGAVPQGNNLVHQFTIGNLGLVDLSIVDITLTEPAFTITTAPSSPIAAEVDGVISYETFDITLDGSTIGNYTATITITTDDDADPIFSFTITGVVADPNAPKMYWTDGNEINRSTIDGILFEQYHAEILQPRGLAIDTTTNELYWTNNFGKIRKGTIDVSGLTGVVDFRNDGIDIPTELNAIALDFLNRNLYYADATNGEIRMADLTDSNPFAVPITVVTTLHRPIGVAVDPSNNHLYFTENYNDGGAFDNIATLYRVDLDGSNLTQLYQQQVNSSQFLFGDVKLDMSNNKIYWSGTNNNEYSPSGGIFTADLTDVSGTLTSIPTLNNQPQSIDLDPITGKLYWIDRYLYMDNPTLIGKSDSDGNNKQTLHLGYTNITSPLFIIVESSASATCTTPHTANAGPDDVICPGDVANLTGSIGGSAITAIWTTNGDGTFSVPNILNPTYTPGTNDLSTGSVTLTLSTTASVCPSVSDQITLEIGLPISVINQSATVQINELRVIDIFSGGFINTSDVIITTLLSQPQKGNVILNANGTIEYTALEGNVGTDTFDFQIENQCNLTASATVIITIPNAAPIFDDANTLGTPGAPITISLTELISDLNGNLDLSSIQIIQQPGSGAPATLNASNNLTVDYTGIVFFGTDEVVIEVCDLDGACATASIFIEIPAQSIIAFNAVSPNGDGKHDFLEFQYIEAYPDNKVTVFNRWGDIVYEIEEYDNVDNNFVGDANKGASKELPTGTYYYTVYLKNTDETITGFFELRR